MVENLVLTKIITCIIIIYMFEIIEGYPIYLYYISLFSQFIGFYLLYQFCSINLFNTFVIIYYVKDFLYSALYNDIIMIMHHIITIVYIIFFCNSYKLCLMVTIGELGSGTYNLYILAKSYNKYKNYAFILYTIVMTFTNQYCAYIFFYHQIEFYYKIIPILLLVGRQLSIYNTNKNKNIISELYKKFIH